MTQVKNDGDLTCEDAKERRAAAQPGGGRKTDEPGVQVSEPLSDALRPQKTARPDLCGRPVTGVPAARDNMKSEHSTGRSRIDRPYDRSIVLASSREER